MLVLAATLQILVGLAFVSIPIVRARYGQNAAANAEAELVRQGVPTSVLKENNLSFDASGHETAAPVTVALIMAALATLNLLANPWGQTLTWIFQPLTLLGNGLILWSQLTAANSVRAAFRKKGDPMLQNIDIPALLKAAESGFPKWVKTQTYIRHTVVFAGSALALIAVSFA